MPSVTAEKMHERAGKQKKIRNILHHMRLMNPKKIPNSGCADCISNPKQYFERAVFIVHLHPPELI